MARMHIISGVGDRLDMPMIRRITLGDLATALRRGAEDFWAKPSHYILLAVIYPVVGIGLAVWMSGFHTWPLLYPLIGGFALIGPVAALPLYEVSRRREQGLDPSWTEAFSVLRSPALGGIAAVAVMLFVLFTLWLAGAQGLYESLFGSSPPRTLGGLLTQVLTEPAGWTLIGVGTLMGGVFALLVLATSVIAFPLLLDRDVGGYVAVETSVRAFLRNPLPILCWGGLVAAGIALGTATLFVGLAVVLPIFGHATWHLYRALVDDASAIRGA